MKPATKSEKLQKKAIRPEDLARVRGGEVDRGAKPIESSGAVGF